MSTTSTGSRATSFASDTVIAVPTMVMSGSSSRTRARDSRIRRWSSTSSTRTGRGLAAGSVRVTGPGSGAAPSPESSVDDTFGASPVRPARRGSRRAGLDPESTPSRHAGRWVAGHRTRRGVIGCAIGAGRPRSVRDRRLPDNRPMRVAFLGLGLIGGSVARALRENEASRDHELVAWSPLGEGPRQALAEGVLDAVAGDPSLAVDGAALV